jgi:hypothetical protein
VINPEQARAYVIIHFRGHEHSCRAAIDWGFPVITDSRLQLSPGEYTHFPPGHQDCFTFGFDLFLAMFGQDGIPILPWSDR